MRKLWWVLIGFAFLLLIIGILTWFRPNVLGIVSPLADDYGISSSHYRFVFEKKTMESYPPNSYFPKTVIPKYSQNLEINASSYAVMERSSGELLLAKNLHQELPIASVAKIMTAVVVLERADLDLELKVSSQAAEIGEAEMGLSSGEKIRVEDLLYGMMLPSGNDAAETLAENLQDGRTSFIISMNQKAKELGLSDTYFFNPTGLDGETLTTTTFSTSLDLLALVNYALDNRKFVEIVATDYKEIPFVEGKHKAFFLNNILQLGRSYPGIKGVKPGVTDFAGETLVSYAENGGVEVIVVLLGTQNSRDEVVKIYDFIFPKLGVNITGRK